MSLTIVPKNWGDEAGSIRSTHAVGVPMGSWWASSLPICPVIVLRRRHHREVKDRLVHATDADAHVRHAGRAEDDARLGQKVLLAIERDLRLPTQYSNWPVVILSEHGRLTAKPKAFARCDCPS